MGFKVLKQEWFILS